MIAPPKISKKAPDTPSKNFNLLRNEGIRYIQKVAGESWTDFNSHDPGVTILEQLVYAINDVSYRSSFHIKDLLAEDTGAAGRQDHFFTPRQILTNNPLTINDFRKVLIDVDGVQNAWLEPRVEEDFYSDGPPFYRDEKEEMLKYVETGEESGKVKLLGLYDVLLEFERDPLFGDLNGNKVGDMFEISSPKSELQGLRMEVFAEYPYWDDHQLRHADHTTLPSHLLGTEITFLRTPSKFIVRESKPDASERFEIYELTSRMERADLVDELQDFYEEILKKLSVKYQGKLERINRIVHNVNARLHNHRNLCEDFIKTKSLRVKEIALCMKVDLDHAADQDKILAAIFHAVMKFFSPAPTPRGLSDLLSRGISVEDIFEGPPLENGFLLDQDLVTAERRHMIYTSDLINEIADIKHIQSVNEIEIAKRTNGDFVDEIEGDQWHLELDEADKQLEHPYYIPRLNLSRTNVRFYKDGVPISVNKVRVYDALHRLLRQDEKPPIKDLDLAIPFGEPKAVANYPSIQSDFPDTYGITEAGLEPTADVERKAKANQLKGYIMLFEQLLANYLAQLANVGQLFSLDTTVKNTYFTKDLFSVPNVAPLVRGFLRKYGFPEDPSLDDEQLLKMKWNEFKAAKNNEFLTHLANLAEKRHLDESVFLDRRNRFLDHLMARFGEQFKEYAMIMHSIDSRVSEKMLIEDKASLIRNYPMVSSNRGKAFNYNKDQSKGYEFTGLELRMAMLLGMDLDNPMENTLDIEKYVDQSGKHRFRMKDRTGEIILNSEEGYVSEHELENIMAYVIESAADPNNYDLRVNVRGEHYFNLKVKGGDEIIARSQEYFADSNDRDEEISRVIEELSKVDEKLYVIEHVLLRPKLKEVDKLLNIRIPPEVADGTCCPVTNDPYSYTISVILPSWPARFRHLEFRRYVEKKIRMETPAHIFPKICWVSLEQMELLEKKLLAWRKSLTQVDFSEKQFLGSLDFEQLLEKELKDSPKSVQQARKRKTAVRKYISFLKKSERTATLSSAQKAELEQQINDLLKIEKLIQRSDAQNELIEVMSSLRTVYPEATLYDCHESESENPVFLNRTILGTFKPLDDE